MEKGYVTWEELRTTLGDERHQWELIDDRFVKLQDGRHALVTLDKFVIRASIQLNDGTSQTQAKPIDELDKRLAGARFYFSADELEYRFRPSNNVVRNLVKSDSEREEALRFAYEQAQRELEQLQIASQQIEEARREHQRQEAKQQRETSAQFKQARDRVYETFRDQIPHDLILPDETIQYLDDAISTQSLNDLSWDELRPYQRPPYYIASAIWFQKKADIERSFYHLATASSQWRQANLSEVAINITECVTRQQFSDYPYIERVLTSRAAALCDKFVNSPRTSTFKPLMDEAITCNDRAIKIKDSHHPYYQLMRSYGVLGLPERSDWAAKMALARDGSIQDLRRIASRTVNEAPKQVAKDLADRFAQTLR